MFIRMVSLSDLGCQQAVLCLFDIKLQLCDDLVCVHLSRGRCRGGRDERWDYPGRSASFQMERGKSHGGIHCVHDCEMDSWEFGKPALLIVVHMIADSLIEHLVSAFTSSICLRVVSGGHF